MGKFFALARWPNLLFIIVTQVLFYFIFFPLAYEVRETDIQKIHLQPQVFYLISIASLLIAAAGYIINDYFDIEIDLINKPSKVIVGKAISKVTAVSLYLILSVSGLLLSGLVSYRLKNPWILPANLVAVLLLYYYSTTFKKKYLVGNVVISLLTAWVILVLPLAEYQAGRYVDSHNRLLTYALLYASFAFVATMIREVVKDVEDSEGDKQFGCTTLPIVSGLRVSKVFTTVLSLALAGLVSILIIYIPIRGQWLAALYSTAFILIPLAIFLKHQKKAVKTSDFHKLSALLKGIMLSGILTMLFFLI